MLYTVTELPRIVPAFVDPYVYVKLECVDDTGNISVIANKTLRTNVDDILRNVVQPNDTYQEIYWGGRRNEVQNLQSVLDNWDDLLVNL